MQRIQANDLLAQYQNGQAFFASLQTFLQGTVKTFTVVPSPTELGWRSLEAAAFLEDVWKVNRRLELRLGFRSESTNGWNEAQGRAANYAIVNDVLQTDPVDGTSALSQNRAKFLPDPRVGFAWDVWGNGKTAVRGGFGNYRSLLDTLDYRLDQTAPFNTAVSLAGVPVSSLQITPGTEAPAGAKVSPSNVQPDSSIPRRVFQPAQSLQLPDSESGGLLFVWFRDFTNRRCHHRHIHQLAPDSVRCQGSVLGWHKRRELAVEARSCDLASTKCRYKRRKLNEHRRRSG